MGVFGKAGAPMGEIWLALVCCLFHLDFSGDYESEVCRTGLSVPQTVTEIEELIDPTSTKRETVSYLRKRKKPLMK